ncbi:MAG: PAS domain S-box protein [Thermodesulfobacteriota bacterium]
MMSPQFASNKKTGFFKRKLQLFRNMDVSSKLNFGFGALLVLLVLIITLCFYTVYMAHEDISRSMDEFYPVTRDVENVQQKLWSMISKERAYLVLGGEAELEDFRRAEKLFKEKFEDLKETVSVEDYTILKEVEEKFEDWHAYSEDVFELRKKPVENYPALRIYKSDIQSLRVSVFRYIRALRSRIEKSSPSEENIQLLVPLLEYKNSLEKVLTNLEEYAQTGDKTFYYLLESYLDSNGEHLNRLAELGESSEDAVSNLVESIRMDHTLILGTIPDILEIAGSEKWSISLNIFKTRITPVVNKMIGTLERLDKAKREQLTTLLENTGRQLKILEKVMIFTAGVAAVLSFFSLWVVFHTFTKPVRSLTNAAESIAQGNFYTRCSLDTKDELGRLAKSFNTMTGRLQGTISKLENHRLYLKEMVDERTLEVRNSREDLRITLDSIGDGVVATDNEGGIKRMNPVAQTLSGWSFEKAEGRPFKDIFTFVDGHTNAVQADLVTTILTSSKPAATEESSILIARDGSHYRVEASGSPILDRDGNPGGVVVVLRDMSDSRRLEAELEESRHRLQRLIDNLPGGMAYRCENNRNYTMSWISKGCLALTGYAPEDLVNDRTVAYGELIHPEDRGHVWEYVQESLDKKEPFRIQYRIHTAAGLEKWVWEKGVGVYDQEGELHGIEGIISDITEQKKAEKEMIAAREQAAEQDKNALVGQVAGKMAHDFNNILAGIMGNAEISLMDFRNKGQGNQEFAKSLELICDLTERGKSLTRNLIAFARDQEIRQEYVNINENIDFVLNLLKNELEPVKVVKNLEEDIPQVLADASMIEHMLVNLIQNALHAMGKENAPVLRISTYSADGNVHVEVEDNGCGIPQEHARDIYTPSFTLKGSRDTKGVYQKGVKGTGYGMANVKKYVEKHKGDITFESREGEGAKFTVRLPVIEEEVSAEEIRKSVTSGMITGRRILLVEDEEVISRMQKHILEQAPLHHIVDVAQDVPEAIRLFGENEYDLVSLDFVLPGDSGGMEVYSHIREKNGTIPILFISGNLEFIESINSIKEKDDYVEHLSKPCKNTEYVTGINRLLQRSG